MPANRLPWIRFWPEAVEHEKFSVLTDAESWSWVVVWAKASLQPKRWRFASVDHAHHVTGRPVKHLRRLIAVGLLDECDEGLAIHDAKDWQDTSNLSPSQREDSPNGGGTPPGRPANGDSRVIEDTSKGDRRVTQDPSKGDRRVIEGWRNGDLEGEGEGDVERDVDPPPPTGEPPKRARRATEVDDAFKAELEEQFWEALGSREAVRDSIAAALGHKARLKYTDIRAYVRNWLRTDAERMGHRRVVPLNGRTRSQASVAADDPDGLPLGRRIGA